MSKLPIGWKIVYLCNKNIVDVIMGQSPPSSTYNEKGVGLPFLQGKAEFGEIYPSPIFWCSNPIKIAEKNDVLLSMRAPVGDVNIAPFKSCIGRGLAAIRAKDNKINYLFLFYYLNYAKNLFKSLSMGSTFKAITKKEVENFQIPFPPLKEQKKIAGVLATVDQAIGEANEAITKTERLKKGLMQELLTKGIGHKEFKETEIGLLPLNWVTKRNFIKIKSGYGFKLEEYSKKGIPLIRIDNIQYGKIDYKNLCYLPESYLKKYKDFVLKKGDIILALNRPITNNELKIGKVEIEPSILYQRIGILEINEEDCDINFYYHYLRSHLFLKKLKSILVGSDQPYIKLEAFSKVSFPKPPLKEQGYIADILSTFDSRMELLKEKKEKLGRVKKGLMNDLLTGRKRVKVEA